MMDDPVIVLHSGGVDSTVCAALAYSQKRLRACVSFNYGQPAASAECGIAKRWCQERHVEWLGLMLPFVFGRAAMKQGIGKPGPRVVPVRNAVFASCAASIAVTLQARVVWYGATKDDEADYADCRKRWVEAMSDVLHLAAGVRLEAPLVEKTKVEVVTLGNELGVNWDETWSCYQAKDKGTMPCGTCNSCVARQLAFTSVAA